MRKKFIIFAVVLLFITISLYYFSFITPKINTLVEIKSPNESQLELFMARDSELTVENCRIISIDIIGKSVPIIIKDIEVNMKDLSNIFIEDERFREISSSGYINKGDIEYSQEVIISLGDHSEEELYKLINDFKIELSWINILDKRHNEIIYVRDILESYDIDSNR